MKRKSQKAMALLTVTALSISSVFTMPASAKSAKPKLSKKRITMWAGTKKKVTIKNAKAVKKVVWKSSKKSVVILKKKTKKSVQLVAKKAGKATVTAKVKAGWKMYKLSCKVTVKKKTGTTVVPPVNTQEPAVVNPGDSSSAVKTAEPVKEPTEEPTRKPAVTATASPTAKPTKEPTQKPTATPTAVPTKKPTATPTTEPTKNPTATPTTAPTAVPTQKPTSTPTTAPTTVPTQTPTAAPTQKPATEKVTLAIDNTFINSPAYSSAWKGTVYNLLPLITASGHKVSDFTQVNVTINLLDANKNIIENTGGASIKLSVKNSDWAGFVDANGMQSGKEQGLQLDAYPSGQTALYLVVQNSTEAVKYIQITSVVMENKGKKRCDGGN
ncbi:MAG: PT domain-containing protein [Clostridium sp.]